MEIPDNLRIKGIILKIVDLIHEVLGVGTTVDVVTRVTDLDIIHVHVGIMRADLMVIGLTEDQDRLIIVPITTHPEEEVLLFLALITSKIKTRQIS